MNLLYLLKPKNTVSYIYSNMTVRQGLEKLRAHGYTAIPVITPDGEYVGAVSDGDFLYALSEHISTGGMKHLEKMSISEILRKKRDSAVTIDASMDELLMLSMEQNFVPVTDDRNKFIGIVTRRDIIKYFYEKERNDEKEGQNL